MLAELKQKLERSNVKIAQVTHQLRDSTHQNISLQKQMLEYEASNTKGDSVVAAYER
jgi:hypothetical protein